MRVDRAALFTELKSSISESAVLQWNDISECLDMICSNAPAPEELSEEENYQL